MAYLSRVLESAFTALEGLNKQAFLTELVSSSFVVFHSYGSSFAVIDLELD